MSDIQATLRALNDKTRRDILTLLKKEGIMAAGDIAAHYDMTQATVSHHLLMLKEAHLIEDERIGKHIYYQINATVVQDLLLWVHNLLGSDEGGNNDENP